MQAVMLVGGFGTRLRPLTFTIPKQMLPVCDVPMLERKIASLVEHGIDDIVLSMGYRPDAFQQAYPDNMCAGAKLTYVIEPEPLGTAGAIAFAAREAGFTSTFLAFNGDILTDMDVAGLISFHQEKGAEATIALTPVDDPSRFGVVPTDANGCVEAFIEKPPADEAPTNLINAGTYVLEASFIDKVTPHQQVSIEREVFPAMVEAKTVFAGAFNKYWLDIGTPDSYLQGNLDLLDQAYDGGSFVADTATVNNADITHSVIGTDVQLGSNVRIVDSVILPGTTIDDNVLIERSIVGEHSHVQADAELRNLTVVGGFLQVEAGSKLDNEKVSPPEVEV